MMVEKKFIVVLKLFEGYDITAKEFELTLEDGLPPVRSFDTIEVKEFELPRGIEFCERVGCIVDERNCWGGTEVCYLQPGCPFLPEDKSCPNCVVRKRPEEGS